MNYLLIGVAVILSVACLPETGEKAQKSVERFGFQDERERREGTILTHVSWRACHREEVKSLHGDR